MTSKDQLRGLLKKFYDAGRADALRAERVRVFAEDAQGHEHKGKGEGGGQFVKQGGEGDRGKETTGGDSKGPQRKNHAPTGVKKGEHIQISPDQLTFPHDFDKDISPLDDNSKRPLIVKKAGDKYQVIDGFGRASGLLNAGAKTAHVILVSDADLNKNQHGQGDDPDWVGEMHWKYAKKTSAMAVDPVEKKRREQKERQKYARVDAMDGMGLGRELHHAGIKVPGEDYMPLMRDEPDVVAKYRTMLIRAMVAQDESRGTAVPPEVRESLKAVASATGSSGSFALDYDTDRVSTFADESDDSPQFRAAFSAADIARLPDYFGADEHGHYGHTLHRHFSLNVKEFAEKAGMVRKQIRQSDGRTYWVWAKREGSATEGNSQAILDVAIKSFMGEMEKENSEDVQAE